VGSALRLGHFDPCDMEPGANSDASKKLEVSCLACRPLNSLYTIPTEMYKIWLGTRA